MRRMFYSFVALCCVSSMFGCSHTHTAGICDCNCLDDPCLTRAAWLRGNTGPLGYPGGGPCGPGGCGTAGGCANGSCGGGGGYISNGGVINGGVINGGSETYQGEIIGSRKSNAPVIRDAQPLPVGVPNTK